MSTRPIANSRSLVTGASSGIGRAIALELARQGGDVLITARREERLREVAKEIESLGRRAIVVAGDITSSAHRAKLIESAQREFGGLDILVNNAGVGALGPFAEASEERLRQVMEVNFFAPLELIRVAMPLLRNGNRPLITNVCSVLGHRGVPKKSEYCASKFALHGFSDALRAELAKERIDVLLVSPSTTESEFFDRVIEQHGPPPTWTKGYFMPAKTVARRAVRAMRRGRHEIILSAGGKLLVWLDRLSPPLVNWLVAKFG